MTTAHQAVQRVDLAVGDGTCAFALAEVAELIGTIAAG
jgi:hypothetical protein